MGGPFDPYDLRHVWLRVPDGWVTVPWTYLPMVNAPFADFTWEHARHLAADRGQDRAAETAVAEALDDLLNRAGQPAETKKTRRVRARTRAAAEAPLHPVISRDLPADHEFEVDESEDDGAVLDGGGVSWGIFDAAQEAQRR